MKFENLHEKSSLNVYDLNKLQDENTALSSASKTISDQIKATRVN